MSSINDIPNEAGVTRCHWNNKEKIMDLFNVTISHMPSSIIKEMVLNDTEDLDMLIDSMFMGWTYTNDDKENMMVVNYAFFGTNRMKLRELVIKEIRKLKLNYRSKALTEYVMEYNKQYVTFIKNERYFALKSEWDIDRILSYAKFVEEFKHQGLGK